MTPILPDVRTLAGEIGARDTGNPGEKAAADLMARRVWALGLPVERQTFRSVAGQNPFPLATDLVSLLAVVVYRLGVRAAQMTMEDEVGTPRRADHRAICIAGRDPATGTLPHWHRTDDTVDTISPEVLERAADFMMALPEILDREALTEQEGVCARL